MILAIRRILLAGLAVSLTAFSASSGGAQPPQDGGSVIAALESSLVDLIERTERSVVSITRYPGQQAGVGGGASPLADRVPAPQIFMQGRLLPGRLGELQAVADTPSIANGAGVIIDASGLVLTQFQVIKLGESHVVTDVDGQRYLAEIRAADSRSGLAVLAIKERYAPDAVGGEEKPGPIKLPALPIGEAERLQKGRLVVAIGNPFAIQTDGQPTASWGTITNTAAKVPDNEALGDDPSSDGDFRTTLHHFGSLIQTDARLGWNSSGGAVVTLDGELVGITTTASAIAGHEQPAGYAIPLNAAMRRAVATMREGLEPGYGLLGVSFNRGAARSAKTGRVGIGVSDAYRGGPAQIAGLETGDLLLSIAGEPVRTPEALQLAVGSLGPGEAVEVGFERGGQEKTTTIMLGKSYVASGQIVTQRRPAWRGLRIDYATAVPPAVLQEKSATGALDEEGCVVVSEVEEGSVSWESGVRPYSYISHVSGQRVKTPQEFYDAVRDAKDNVKLKFTKPLTAGPETLN